MHYKLNEFESYLKSVDLEKYRLLYSPIKIVEMDLSRDIQALEAIYKLYWDENNLFNHIPSFDQFYEFYYSEKQTKINNFKINVGFGNSCDCFDRGLKARIYRTWASLVTQIQAAYVAESLFGYKNVYMSEDLDHQNIDIKLKLQMFSNKEIGIQIKKESKRRDARVVPLITKKSELPIFSLFYFVPNRDDFDNPFYQNGIKKGQLKPQLNDFIEFNKNEGILKRLDNGFVVFLPSAFDNFLDINNIKRLIAEYEESLNK